MPPQSRTVFPVRPFAVMLSSAVLLSACARAGSGPGGGVGTAPAPVMEPAMQPVMQAPIQVAPPPPARVSADTAQADWQRLDYDTDHVMGVGSERAMRELLATRQPQRRVVVAVIDGGVDTAHTRLARSMWKNPREIASNGKDDDGNGVIDDVFGWSALATADGTPVRYDTFELTRLYAACRNQPAGSLTEKPTSAECSDLASAYRDKAKDVKSTLLQVENIDEILQSVERMLGSALRGAPLTRASVTALRPTSAASAGRPTSSCESPACTKGTAFRPWMSPNPINS